MQLKTAGERLGTQLARLLAHSWRAEVPAADVSAESLDILAARLPATGAAGLAWERLRNTPLASHPAAKPLRDIYRRNALLRLGLEHRLPRLIADLRREGLDPLLIKGWSLVSLYPKAGQRPVGDIDLCVPPDQFPAAQRWLQGHPDQAREVDLHAGVSDLPDRSWEEVWQRSGQVEVQGGTVRILCPEDQLRLLCLHFTRHGGWRPLWLCDIAAAAESMPALFEWDHFLAGNDVSSSWVRGMLALAGELLQASVPALPLPRWVLESVLGAWEAPKVGDSHSRVDRPLGSYLTRPWGWWRAIGQRWPNALEAAFKMQASPSTQAPLCWHQLRYLLKRGLGWSRKPSAPHTTGTTFSIHIDE